MRWYNGTRTFRIDPFGNNISQVDYPGNDGCNGVNQIPYTMYSGTCFPLFSVNPPHSFLWMVVKGKNTVASSAEGRHHGLVLRSACALAVLASILASAQPTVGGGL